MTTLKPPPTARFDEFEVDLRHFELRKAGKKIKIACQPIQFLSLPLRRPGEIVSRQKDAGIMLVKNVQRPSVLG